MAWRIKFERAAERELAKLGSDVAKRVLAFLHERVAKLENPRLIGEALKGSELGDFWKYRVGDYRIIANIEDQTVQILIVRIGNRRDIHRR
ncbi:type II toxin-antitoxin system RelE family toxin [Rhizobium sullae]|uniref:mRNA interferase RelE/StbE n=1 Tax=Rhizobium sullae TaxID=50338 RepID=A0A4V2V8I1_RHISU|nr:type II toxin-antitoxin system RelE/ParE family toxin [Rhizobium sullae]TCU13385.1 mRNA interferase RelE/StbE [Rhizobium sullae]